jgi:hypothetical protein
MGDPKQTVLSGRYAESQIPRSGLGHRNRYHPLCLRATYGADSNPGNLVGSAMTLMALRVFEVTRGAASAGERLHRPVIDLVMLDRSRP